MGRLGIGLALCSAATLSLAGCKLSSGGGCMDDGKATVAQYEDCERLCKQGNRDACNRRSQVESGLSQACLTSGATDACKALCHGRKQNQRACHRLRELLGNN